VRTVLLSGACGAGKSAILKLGARAFEPHFGRTATFDTDELLMMVDPRWELAHEERRFGVLFEQCWLLADSFARGGFDTVVIGGNALHTPDEMGELVPSLASLGPVFHVTLDPALDEIVRRVANRGADKSPEWLRVHVEWMHERYEATPWTCRIDNTSLTMHETLEEIARRTAAGEGRCP
jgi:chloramphenicol 3-O-phosphotransferase